MTIMRTRVVYEPWLDKAYAVEAFPTSGPDGWQRLGCTADFGYAQLWARRVMSGEDHVLCEFDVNSARPP